MADELITLLDGMTPKMRLYAEARMAGHGKVASGRVAGISDPDKNYLRLEKHPKVQQALELFRKKGMERVRITREDVLRGFLDATDAAATGTELVAAWREIGKMLGYYEAEKVEVNVRNITAEKLARLSDKELAELADAKDWQLEGEDVIEGEFQAISDSVSPLHSIEHQVTDDRETEPAED